MMEGWKTGMLGKKPEASRLRPGAPARQGGQKAEARVFGHSILPLFHHSLIPIFLLSASWSPAQTAAPASSNGLAFAQGRVELIDKPDYRPHAPLKRGQNYPMVCTDLNRRAMWGWRLELKDGSGLAFGGIATWTMQEGNDGLKRSDDPCVRTQVRRDGKWVFIHEELRRQNPLQANHDRVLALRAPLKMLTTQARYIYFEGRDEAAEKAFIEKQVLPRAVDLAVKLKAEQAALAKTAGLDPYLAGQAARAVQRLARAIPAIEGIGSRTDPGKLEALRLARVELEMAAEVLDAEPPARVLSMPAYDAKTGLYVIFGGDHFDFLRNDLWVFDPKVLRWEQRHPALAPEPRADHLFVGDGQGRFKMSGGFIYARRPLPPGWDRHAHTYVHAGEGEWIYDLTANAWTGPAEPPMEPADTRFYRSAGHMPAYYAEGLRPDAAAQAKVLAELPVNTWVDLKPPQKFAGNRDWGTLGFDVKRDLIYFYNGGHSAYAGTDVARYHLAANRWDQPVEVEYPHGLIGASGRSLPGWSFNRRPWITNHMWNSYRFHPGLDRLVVAGRLTSPCFPRGMGNPDVNLYFYDPDLGDWEKRTPNSVEMSCMGAHVIHVPEFGMIDWGRWLLDDATLQWKKLEPKGKLPGSSMDFAGLIHDAKRSRVLFFSGGNYDGTPYSGEVFAMAIPSLEVTSFKPEGSEHIGAVSTKATPRATWILREVVHHPGLDHFIFSSNLPGGYSAALDMKGNRWVGLKIPGPHPFGLSSAMAYDAKRDLIYSVGTRADISAVRLDPKTLEMKPLAEIAAAAVKAAGDAKAAKP